MARTFAVDVLTCPNCQGLVPVIDGTYCFADIREAFRRFGTGDHHGKVVVSMTAESSALPMQTGGVAS